MTKDEIMEMAYEAGIEEAYSLRHDQVLVQFLNGSLERFAALVEAKEREACAKVCDEYAELFIENDQAKDCADAVRARNQGES